MRDLVDRTNYETNLTSTGFNERSALARPVGSLSVPGIPRAESGFTVIELLVAMALIVLIMSTLNQAFSEGVSAFRDLEAVGDLDEKLVDDCFALTQTVMVTNERAREFIKHSLETETVSRDEATALREQYEAICATALGLEVRLREVQRHIEDPGARLVLQRSLDALTRLKFSAAFMVRLLRHFE
jgi:prepilin-type N-terminal cleavage/methylation domain-containing protein